MDIHTHLQSHQIFLKGRWQSQFWYFKIQGGLQINLIVTDIIIQHMIQNMIVSPETQDIGHPTLPHSLLAEVQTLQQQIVAEIENGCLKIASNQNIVPNAHNASNMGLKKKLRQLGSIKEQLVNKLREISDEQRQIKALSQKLEKTNHRNRREKSILNEADKQRIAEIKRLQKQFEVMIRNKINRVMQEVKQKQQEEEEQRMFQSDMKRKQRIVKLVQKRAKIAESRSKTLQMLDSPTNIKKTQYTYIKYQLKDKKLQEQKKRIDDLILKQKKQKLKIDFKEIKEAALEHDRIISEKKEDFLFEFKQSQIRKRTKTVAYESQFSRKLKSEEKIKEIERARQDEARRQVRERTMNYRNILEEKYKPKITQESAFVPKKQVQVLEQLSYVQARQKGDQFLRIACKKAKRRVELDESKIEVTSDQIGPSDSLPTSTSQKYPNYLIDLKKKKRERNVLQRALKQKRLSSKKVEEVIRWMQKKQEGTNIGPQKSVTKSQYCSALEKIKLLNSIYENGEI